MPLHLVTVPCLADNYAFLLHSTDSGATAVIDVPEAKPIIAALEERNWKVSDVWFTHHHDDHIQGLADLAAYDPYFRVTGAKADAHRMPPLTHAVGDGDTFSFSGTPVNVFDVSGHTVGHIAFYVAALGTVFTGDSLMALGCGRLFEGTPETMWNSLQKIAALPGNSWVCSGHEYSASNAKFALSVDPDNPALIARAAQIANDRAAHSPTVPSILQDELDTNPFLRAHLPEMKARLGMADKSDIEVFGELRARKDVFKG